MSELRLPPLSYALAGLAVVGVGLYVWKRGGIANAVAGAGSAIVGAADQAVAGGVGAVGAVVGLPTPSQTTTDAAVARWLIDSQGWFTASKWSSAGALISGMAMSPGTGTAPAPGSMLDRQFPHADYDETDRLKSRYPAPITGDEYGWAGTGIDPNNPQSWGMGL